MNGIPLGWSDSGPVGTRNVFGEVVSSIHTDQDGAPLPLTCMHGGSAWCCDCCAKEALKQQDRFRTSTDEERARLRRLL